MYEPDSTRLIRRMVLSGRTILCGVPKGAGGSAGRLIRQVAAMAGLDVQVVGFFAPEPLTGLDPAARRPAVPDEGEWFGLDAPDDRGGAPEDPDPDDVENARRLSLAGEPIPGRLLCAPTGRPLSGDDAGFLAPDAALVDVRPPLDLAPALSGRGVVILEFKGEQGARYLSWLARACIDAASAEGRPPPLIFGDVHDIQGLKHELGWAGKSDGYGVYVLHPDGDRTVERRHFGDDKAWLAAIDARLAMATASRDGPVWTVRGEGRTVRAIRSGVGEGYKPAKPDRELVTFAEIDAAGMLRGTRITVDRRLDDAEMADLAAQCWLAGAKNVTHEEKLNASEFTTLVGELHGTWMMNPGEIALRGLLVDDLGEDAVAFLRAVSWGRHAPALQRWAMPGGKPSTERMQFAVSYPSLAPLALDPEVTRLVDARRPPMPRLCELMGAEPALVRRFGAERVAYAPMYKPGHWQAAGTVLRAAGHGGLPAEGASFEWYNLFRTLDRLRFLDGDPGAEERPGRLLGLARRLPGRTWAARHRHLAAIPQRESRDCRDLLASIRQWFSNLAGREIDRPILAFAEDYGTVDRIMEASRRWHAHPTLRASSGGLPPGTSWPVPFGTIEIPEIGGHATCLASVVALADEGASGPDGDGVAGLSHCIAGRSRPCLIGKSLVISFRSDTPGSHVRLSTMELVPDPEGEWLIAGRPYRETEHRGKANSAPPRLAMSMRDCLLDLLADGHPVDAAALDPRPDAPYTLMRDTGLELYPLWRPILPRRWARLGPDGIVAALDAEAWIAPAGAAA